MVFLLLDSELAGTVEPFIGIIILVKATKATKSTCVKIDAKIVSTTITALLIITIAGTVSTNTSSWNMTPLSWTCRLKLRCFHSSNSDQPFLF